MGARGLQSLALQPLQPQTRLREPMKLYSPESSIVSVGGQQFEADDDGIVVIPDALATPEIVEQLRGHGLTTDLPKPKAGDEKQPKIDEKAQKNELIARLEAEFGVKADARKSLKALQIEYENLARAKAEAAAAQNQGGEQPSA